MGYAESMMDRSEWVYRTLDEIFAWSDRTSWIYYDRNNPHAVYLHNKAWFVFNGINYEEWLMWKAIEKLQQHNYEMNYHPDLVGMKYCQEHKVAHSEKSECALCRAGIRYGHSHSGYSCQFK